MTDSQRKEFQELARPLMRWLADNFNPHTSIIITNTDAEVLSGEMAFNTVDFIKD